MSNSASTASAPMRSNRSLALSGTRRRAEALIVSALGAVLLYSGSRWETLAALVGVSYTVMLLPALMERWRAPIVGFYPGLLGAAIAMNWTLSQFAWFAPLLLPPLLSWHWIFMPLLVWSLRCATSWPAYFILPIALGAEQWLRPVFSLGNYNMYEIGTFLYPYPILIQMADIFGSIGLTVIYGCVLGVGVEFLRPYIDGDAADGSRVRRRGLVLAGVLVAIVVSYGAWRLSQEEDFEEGPRIAIVQPSQDHDIELTPKVLLFQQRLTIDKVAKGSADMVAWPENAIMMPYTERPEYRDAVMWIARTVGAPLLFGTQLTGPDGKRPTASSLLVDQSGEILWRYDKIYLFPFTERRLFASFEQTVPWLYKAIQDAVRTAWGRAPDGWAGKEATVMEHEFDGKVRRFWAPLCYDICYTVPAREAARNGAEFFVNLTSEGWNGWGVTRNQMGSAILRAVEYRVGVVRVGNTGLSGFVAPSGRVEEYLEGENGRRLLDVGVLTRRVTLDPRAPTIYAAIGGVTDPAWMVLWFLIVIGAMLRRRLRPLPTADGDS